MAEEACFEASISRVMRGDVSNLPPLNSQVIRIFTSSTFTDTAKERNSLIERVYPKIQHHCRSKYGLEFQVIDMRWGVTDDITDDHQTAALCLQEIENCQKLSAGPNFVAFLGQRHGSQSFPTAIGKDEYDTMKGKLVEMDVNTTVLDTWFTLDQNAIPPVYVLQPISSKIPDFLSTDESKKKRARNEWNTAYRKLQILLRQAAKSCRDTQEMSKDMTDKYFKSVTETEIDQGIFNAKDDPNTRVLCFVRIIEDIMDHLTDEKAARFIDMLESRLDEEAQSQLCDLRDTRLVNVVQTLHRFKVMWKDVTDGSETSPSDYLQNFINLFEKAVIQMIDRNIIYNRELAQGQMQSEVLHHLHMVKNRCEIFHGRADVMEKIEMACIQSPSNPIIVYGPSGCGKTSIIAKSVEQIRTWMPEKEAVIVTRMIGTTPLSTNILHMLIAICRQIALCYNITDVELTDEISAVTEKFHELLAKATVDKPLYLILDSLDQLSPREGAYRLHWLPRILPPHVIVILSTLPEMHGLLHTLHKRYEHGTYVEVPSLGGDTSQEILFSWLTANKRELTQDQMKLVNSAFKQCSLALYVKLIFDEVLSWKSYYEVSELHLETTIREVIFQLFTKLQKTLGKLFVNHCLGYITASKSGISETELEDALSLDDAVLTDVFQYHVPPIRRIPQLLWLRLKNDIKSFLVNRESDGARVIFWYHRQFIEAAKDFFLDNTERRLYLHNIMTEYYLGMWHDNKKPFKYNEYQMKKLGLSSPESSADRKVVSQPLMFKSDESETGETKRYNLRKLNNLPYHLSCSENYEILRERCLYNYHWLLEKIKATNVQSVVLDFELLPHLTESDSLLCNVLRRSKSTLNKEPSTLALEIIGSLLPYRYQSAELDKLINDCYYEGTLNNALVPRVLCYSVPGGPNIHGLEHAGLPARKKSLAMASEPALLGALTKLTNTLLVWQVEDGELIQEVCLWQEEEPKFNILKWNENESLFVCACAFQASVNPVALYDPKAEVLQVIKMQKCYPKVGFIDCFEIDVFQDRIIICVSGKDCDIFDRKGNLLFSPAIQPTSMHLVRNVLFLPSKKDPVVERYCLEGKGNVDVKRINLSSKAKQIVVSSQLDMIVFYGEDLELDWFNGDKFIKKINIHQKLRKAANVIDIKVEDKYVLFITKFSVVLWSFSKSKIIHELLIPDKLIPSDKKVAPLTASMTTNGSLVVCAYDGHIIVWDSLSGRLLNTIKASPVPITDLLIGSCGGTNILSDALVTATASYRTLDVWDVSQADLRIHHPVGLENAGRYLTLAPDSHMAVCRGRDVRETKIIDMRKCLVGRSLLGDDDSMEPAITQNGMYIILRNYEMEQSMRIYSVGGDLLHVLPKFSIYLKKHSVVGTNRLLATHEEVSPSEGMQTKIWDLETGSLLRHVNVTSGGISEIMFMQNDSLLVTHQLHPFTQHNQDTVLHVYSVNSGQHVHDVTGLAPDSSITQVPNSCHVVAVMSPREGETIRSVAIIDVTTGEIIARHARDIPRKLIINISADGETAVDSECLVFDIYKGDILYDLTSQSQYLGKLILQLSPKLSANGKYVVWIEPLEMSVKVGRVCDREIIGVCYTHSQPVSFGISKDNVVLVSLYDGRLMFLSLVDKLRDSHMSQIQELQDFGNSHNDRFSSGGVKLRNRNDQSCLCSVL